MIQSLKMIGLYTCLRACLNHIQLVTALEANTDVPMMELVTERLLHEERKLKAGRVEVISASKERVMAAGHRNGKRGPSAISVENLVT